MKIESVHVLVWRLSDLVKCTVQMQNDKACVFIFTTTFVCNISYSKKNSAMYCRKRTDVFMQSTRHCIQILTLLTPS